MVSHTAGRTDIFVGVRIRGDHPVHRAEHHNAPRHTTFDNMLAKLTGQEEITGGILQVPLELILGDVGPVFPRSSLAVVDEDVDLSRLLHGIGKATEDGVLVLVIECYRRMIPLRMGQGGSCQLAPFDISTADNDLRPGLGQGGTNGLAQEPGTAGD